MSETGTARSGFANVNGATLYYEVTGTGHPLVLLHAGIADSRMWDAQVAAFAERYQVIRYDLRGFGRSDVPPGPFSHRDDVLGMLHFLGIERAYVLGCSMGGSTAIDFALEHPAMVDGLVLVGSGLGGFQWSDENDAVEAAIEAAMAQGNIDEANELEMRMWVDGPRRPPEHVDPQVRRRVAEMNGLLLRREHEKRLAQPQPLDPPAVSRLGDIHVPALVIIGDEDVADIQHASDQIAASIPNARKVVMHDTAHVPNMERPAEFNGVVLDFLASL